MRFIKDGHPYALAIRVKVSVYLYSNMSEFITFIRAGRTSVQ